jgi:hypothetical protein
MNDDYEYLRLFRSETPEPSTDAWNRARAAVATAAREDAARAPKPPQLTQRRRLLSRPRRPYVVLLGLVSIAVVAGALVVAVTANSGLTGPVHSSWRAAHALPAGQAHLHAATGTWVLADYLTSEGWQQNTTGPEPGNLTCPAALTCYVTGDNASYSSGPAQYDSFYVSHDGALSWSVLPVPNGVDFTTPLSCADVEHCAAGATDHGQAVFITTGDGGHSFTIDPLPSTVGGFYSLECPTLAFCAGLVATSSQPDGVPQNASFLSTSTNGASFTDSNLPVGESMVSLACPTASSCVSVGTSDATDDSGLVTGVVALTNDAGKKWTSGALPAGFGVIDYLSRISCGDALHCSILGNIAVSVAQPSECSSVNPQPPTTSTTLPTSTPGAAVLAIEQLEAGYAAEANVIEAKDGSVTCGDGPMIVSDIASTSDGGLTWIPEVLPASAPEPQLSDIVCASADYCIATGSVAVPQRFQSGAINGGSAIVLVTTNDGTDWKGVSFSVPSTIPSGVQYDAFMAVGDVQCPLVNDCVALGVSDQGSKTTPVYRSTASNQSTNPA